MKPYLVRQRHRAPSRGRSAARDPGWALEDELLAPDQCTSASIGPGKILRQLGQYLFYVSTPLHRSSGTWYLQQSHNLRDPTGPVTRRGLTVRPVLHKHGGPVWLGRYRGTGAKVSNCARATYNQDAKIVDEKQWHEGGQDCLGLFMCLRKVRPDERTECDSSVLYRMQKNELAVLWEQQNVPSQCAMSLLFILSHSNTLLSPPEDIQEDSIANRYNLTPTTTTSPSSLIIELNAIVSPSRPLQELDALVGILHVFRLIPQSRHALLYTVSRCRTSSKDTLDPHASTANFRGQVPLQPLQQRGFQIFNVVPPTNPTNGGQRVPNVNEANETVPQRNPVSFPGQRFTSGGSTYEILGRLDPQEQQGQSRTMSDGLFRVRRVGSATVYAMKRLKLDRPGRTRAEVNVAEQIRETGSPRHLNLLVKLLLDDVTMQASLLFELCDMGNVEQAIHKHRAACTRYEEKSIWIHCAGLVKALAFLHEGVDLDRSEIKVPGWNMVAHLDIKPANIFLSSQGGKDGVPRIVLGDFGCAVSRDDVMTGRASKWTIGYGTTGWYPPEAANRGNPRYGKPTDIWQLGGVLQVISLLSTLPSLSQLGRGEPCSRDYSKALNHFVITCMYARPEARPSILTLAKRLKKILGVDF
nr:serine/threonine-protein kinase kin3 [Quercus suber]